MANPKSERSIPDIFIRFMVGAIFLSEGIQKFLFPSLLGSGRFAKLGIPMPEILGPFVGGVEIVCGTLILIGFFTGLAAIPLFITILVAIAVTKAPMLSEKGLWVALHEGRADFSMFMGLLFLMTLSSRNMSYRSSKPSKQ